MNEVGIDRELFLAVPSRTYKSLFRIPLGMTFLKRRIIKLLVFDTKEEVLLQWIPD